MSKLEQLQEELKKYQNKRDEVILEMGECAQENQDLRENGAYIALEQRAHYFTAKIYSTMKEIHDLTFKPKKLTKKKDDIKLEGFKPHKWF